MKKRKRVGRGGSRGGTSGKGHKGQKARSGGYVRPGFEGGQMPLFRRLPRRGFNNVLFKKEYTLVKLTDLENHFTDGQEVSLAALAEKGIVKKVVTCSAGESKQPGCSSGHVRGVYVKVLGNGILTKKLVVQAHAFSASASEAIKKNGGEVYLIQES